MKVIAMLLTVLGMLSLLGMGVAAFRMVFLDRYTRVTVTAVDLPPSGLGVGVPAYATLKVMDVPGEPDIRLAAMGAGQELVGQVWSVRLVEDGSERSIRRVDGWVWVVNEVVPLALLAGLSLLLLAAGVYLRFRAVG